MDAALPKVQMSYLKTNYRQEISLLLTNNAFGQVKCRLLL